MNSFGDTYITLYNSNFDFYSKANNFIKLLTVYNLLLIVFLYIYECPMDYTKQTYFQCITYYILAEGLDS